MRMGYNMMNVMRLGIEFSPSARLQGLRYVVHRGSATLHRLPVLCRL